MPLTAASRAFNTLYLIAAHHQKAGAFRYKSELRMRRPQLAGQWWLILWDVPVELLWS
jgi:hypothetical protein